jgi:hypothetical protein
VGKCNAARSAASPDRSPLPKSEQGSRLAPHPAPLKPTGRGRDESWHARDAEDGWQPGKPSRSRRNKQQVAGAGWHGRRPKIRRSPGPSNGAEGPGQLVQEFHEPFQRVPLYSTWYMQRPAPAAAIGGGPPRRACARRRAVWCVLGHPGSRPPRSDARPSFLAAYIRLVPHR